MYQIMHDDVLYCYILHIPTSQFSEIDLLKTHWKVSV